MMAKTKESPEEKKDDNVHTDTFESSTEQQEVIEETAVETEVTAEQIEGEEVAEVANEPAEEVDVVAKLEGDILALRDQLLRKTADFENQKRRVERERVQLFTSARVDAIRKFLDINDDLTRTLDPANIKEVPEAFLKGVEMIAEKYKNVLDGYNVSAINEINVPFDVDKHDALLRQPAPDESIESNTVIQILKPGYMMGDFVIRHAKVIVSQ